MRVLMAALFCAATALPAAAQNPFPINIGGPYTLVDQFGQTRTEADPQGRAQLVFFGYANCVNICSIALPLMAEVADVLARDGIEVTPVLITVDPDQDRVETMGAPLARIHPDFVGLTGDADALQQAYDAFAVEVTPLFEDPEYGWIYAHGSFVHLLDGTGKTLTIMPPVLNADRAAEIARSYLDPRG